MKERIVAAMPLVSLALFLTSGLVWESWGLGVSFFLLVPLSTILLARRPVRKLSQLMPLVSLTLFLWLWLGFDLAHPGWVVFLLIPLANILLNPHADARSFVTFAVTLAYVVMGILIEGFWHPGWLVFFLIPIVNIIFFPTKRSRYRRGGRYFYAAFSEFISDFSDYSGKTEETKKTNAAEQEDAEEIDVEIRE